jgi:hypothetical protein
MEAGNTLSAPSRPVMLCGTDQEDAAARLLQAGPLSAELDNGGLRYVRFGAAEVLRGIAYLVRDENWGTFAPTISELRIEETPARFLVTYRAVCEDPHRRLSYAATISGSSDGTLAFEVTAEPQTDILTNRTGFVVLHPSALAGRPVRVTHVDGQVETAQFPALISPAQPLFDIRALEHEISPGVWASVRMEGDGFEMEDQRNWGDASYKTYVGSLLKPWPYMLPKGSRQTQGVRLSISGDRAVAAGIPEGSHAKVTVGDPAGQMPAVGIGVPEEEAEHALGQPDLLRRLGPRLLSCWVDLRRELRLPVLDAYRRLGETTGAAIDLEIVIGDERDPTRELTELGRALAEVGLVPHSLAVSTAADLLSWQPGQTRPNEPTPEAICAAARVAFPGARLGGGMLSYFTEINRKHPPTHLVDHVGHATCPIVHAADDRSVMETLEALPAIIASTRAFAGDRPYRIGPSAIGCRDNPYGKAPFENPENGRVCLARVDPRQRGLFGAAYLLGYAAACARGGLDAVVLGAPTGPFGFIYRRTDYPQPWFDALQGDAVYPAYHVIAGLARGSGRPRLDTTVSGKGIVGLAFRDSAGTALWLANLAASAASVAIEGMGGTARLALLDQATFVEATQDPEALDRLESPLEAAAVRLDAYAVARLTWP